jgi:hypothetical protein
MPLSHVTLSRSWAWPVAGLAILASGCTRQDPHEQLVSRTEQAMADLERLRPQLAKAGTPEAEALTEQLGAVRAGLAALPAAATQAVEAEPPPPPPPALVRCPDAGCWRLGVQTEIGAWTVNLRGGGDDLTDSGPLAVGLAMALEQAQPIDHALEWSWGVEGVGTMQHRTGGQQILLIGVRPVIRAALALHDAVAITARPLIEVGQASVQLGSDPGGVLDRANVYAALGARVGLRMRMAIGGDLTTEIGFRQAWFTASAGPVDYRVTITSPEFAVGWAGRF